MPARSTARVIYHYYWFGDQAKTGENSNNVALHYFKNEDPGAFVSISGGGVLASSKQEDAQAVPESGSPARRPGHPATGTDFEYAVGAARPRPEAWCRSPTCRRRRRSVELEQHRGHRADDRGGLL